MVKDEKRSEDFWGHFLRRLVYITFYHSVHFCASCFGNRCSSLGVDGIFVDTADSFTINRSNLHISVFTPRAAPRVLHKDVVNSVFGAVADSQDAVIEINTALGRVKHTA